LFLSLMVISATLYSGYSFTYTMMQRLNTFASKYAHVGGILLIWELLTALCISSWTDYDISLSVRQSVRESMQSEKNELNFYFIIQ